MDLEKFWNKALKKTEIIRARVKALQTSQETHVPYVLLSESSINLGDTVVRRGEILVHKPSLIVPPNNPQFSGFDFEEEDGVDENSLVNYLLIRGVTLPSMRYDNSTSVLNVFEGKLSAAIKHYQDLFAQEENVSTGLIAGPEDCWQFSLLIFICSQVMRNAETDFKKLFDNFNKDTIN